ncbi:MAG: hypothetical protein IIA45_04280 [Bacteroidetes bacterium]|nr:hypothetical protein [Bacteroidota bacterium]
MNIDQFIKLNHVSGLEINLVRGKIRLLNLVEINKRNEKIEFNLLKYDLESIDELKQNLSSDIPISLTLTGNGIIHRTIKFDPSNEDKLLAQILPNANSGDFFIQSHRSTGGNKHVSIIRNDLIESIICQLTKLGYFVVDLNLGPFIVNSISSLLLEEMKNDNYELRLGPHLLKFHESSLLDYNEDQNDTIYDTVSIGQNDLPGKLIIAFASAFNTIHTTSLSNHLEVNNQMNEWRNKKFFHYLKWSVLSIFLSVVLVNFLINNNLSKSNASLSMTISHNKEEVRYLAELQNSIQTKEDFFVKSAWFNSSKTSYYADQLGQSVSSSISLTEMKLFPEINDVNHLDQAVLFESNIIEIVGSCKNGDDLNQWIRALKKMNWIKNVLIQNYSENRANKTANFVLQINLI